MDLCLCAAVTLQFRFSCVVTDTAHICGATAMKPNIDRIIELVVDSKISNMDVAEKKLKILKYRFFTQVQPDSTGDTSRTVGVKFVIISVPTLKL